MPAAPEPSVSVTLAEIARLAGVGRAAVSNWRRRHASFPEPVGGTDTSPQFALTDVQQWLSARGKLKEAGSRLEWLWPQFEALGDRDTTGNLIASFGTAALGRDPADTGERSGPRRRVVEEALRAAGPDGGREAFAFLLDRWLTAHVRQISVTPAPLARLMVAALAASRPGTTPRTVLDPACGAGGLLLAAARHWGTPGDGPRLLGQERDPVLARLAAVRLALTTADVGQPVGPGADIRAGDTLRADAWPDETADAVLSNPPFNERSWGQEELTTDPRWVYGHPPRTEPELAWVQHVLAHLAPGGTAVVVLPPAAAARRAGRRIRAALLRGGALRAVIALPPGAAPPHAVALQLWLLYKPRPGETAGAGSSLLFVDTARPAGEEAPGGGKPVIDWESLGVAVPAAVGAHLGATDGAGPPAGSTAVPVIDLLDDQVDLTPARHVPAAAVAAGRQLRDSWREFGARLRELRETAEVLAGLPLDHDGPDTRSITVEELERAGALTLHSGRTPRAGTVQGGQAPDGAVPLLTVADLMASRSPAAWLTTADAAAEPDGPAVTADGDVVVAGTARAFDAWVERTAPVALGPQLHLLRTDPAVLDPWFLAGCLRAPANGRQAGSHASTASRVNVRRLRVLRLPPAEQRRYGEVFRQLHLFERSLREAGRLGGGLVAGMSDSLAAGRLTAD
ncbi:N-6 DNA methylase [Streptomyces sodiiphilus]|uniref:N-6 DNA methylase n=2 Tax=Streptomyces sodiiphilus TaxID=226217 RepID=A0ABN2PE87_9ACTN